MIDTFQSRESDPLPNHIATVEEYLNVFRHLKPDTTQQIHLFRQFTHYIIASCSEKMIRRMRHWSSRGFIYSLGNIKDQSVQNAYQLFASATKGSPLSKRKDSALGNILRDMRADEVSQLMRGYPGNSNGQMDLHLTSLQASFKDMLDSKLEPADLYNEQTSVEFHHLLVATLMGYGEALANFQEC